MCKLLCIFVTFVSALVVFVTTAEAQQPQPQQPLQVPNGTIQVPALVPGVAMVPAVPADTPYYGTWRSRWLAPWSVNGVQVLPDGHTVVWGRRVGGRVYRYYR